MLNTVKRSMVWAASAAIAALVVFALQVNASAAGWELDYSGVSGHKGPVEDLKLETITPTAIYLKIEKAASAGNVVVTLTPKYS